MMSSPALNVTVPPPVDETVTPALTVISSVSTVMSSVASAVRLPLADVSTLNVIGLLAVSTTSPPALVEVITAPMFAIVNAPVLTTCTSFEFELLNARLLTAVSIASSEPIPERAVITRAVADTSRATSARPSITAPPADASRVTVPSEPSTPIAAAVPPRAVRSPFKVMESVLLSPASPAVMLIAAAVPPLSSAIAPA